MSKQQISLQLQRVKCRDETGGNWVTEGAGNDEIILSGFGIDATGQTVMLPVFSVYPHFDDGDVKNFEPAKTLFTLDVPNEGTFPKTCVATLILAEQDSGGLTEVAEAAFEKAKEQLGEKKEVMFSGVAPLEINWGAVWEEVKPILYGYITDKIASGFSDDMFPPQAVSVDVSSADFYWGDGTKLSPEITVEFRGHDGVYDLVYYWEIRTVETAHG